MKDLLQRLTSRKFLLALATLITLAANKQWAEFTAASITYVLAQGGVDAAQAIKQGREAVQQALETTRVDGLTPDPELDVDKTIITSGVIPPTP